MVCADAYCRSVNICFYDLSALNGRLSGRPLTFVNEISAAKLKDELTSRELRTAIGYGITHFKGQPVTIAILYDANDPRAFKMEIGKVGSHAA
jgi:hypothetical protein